MREVVGVGLVLQVFGEGDGVKPVLECFLNPDIGPHATVGEHGMLVEVHFDDPIPRHIRKDEGTPVLAGYRHGDQSGKEGQKKEGSHGAKVRGWVRLR
jgi:hypothetical protein